MTSSKWAKLTKCSQDTAYRDIQELIDHGILIKDAAGGATRRAFAFYLGIAAEQRLAGKFAGRNPFADVENCCRYGLHVEIWI